MIRVWGSITGRIAFKVFSVALTGMASTTRSDPAAAISADGAVTSITPSSSARCELDGDRL